MNVIARTWTKEQFEAAVKASFSIRQALIKLDLVPAGGNYATFHNAVKAYSTDISHFLGSRAPRDVKTGFYRRPLKELLVKGCYSQSNRLRKRLLRDGLLECKCYACGRTEWAGQLIPLELDHINGDKWDNRLSNLRLLCPNCHALTPTYRGRGIKSQRPRPHKVARPVKKVPTCVMCGKIVAQGPKCRECHQKSTRKVSCRPSRAILREMVDKTSYSAVGRKYGVSDNAIRKWLR